MRSFVNTLCGWYSTVRGLMNNRAPTRSQVVPSGHPGTALKRSHLSESERWRRDAVSRVPVDAGRAADLPLAKSGASLPW